MKNKTKHLNNTPPPPLQKKDLLPRCAAHDIPRPRSRNGAGNHLRQEFRGGAGTREQGRGMTYGMTPLRGSMGICQWT